MIADRRGRRPPAAGQLVSGHVGLLGYSWGLTVRHRCCECCTIWRRRWRGSRCRWRSSRAGKDKQAAGSSNSRRGRRIMDEGGRVAGEEGRREEDIGKGTIVGMRGDHGERRGEKKMGRRRPGERNGGETGKERQRG
eukprot:748901-Hanusia_phi.AAC.1